MKFNQPMSLRTLVDQCQTDEQAVRKASRILRVHFRRQREAAIGPDLSHRRTLANAVVESPVVQETLRAEAKSPEIRARKNWKPRPAIM